VADARRRELRSDLWEHQEEASAGGRGRLRFSLEVAGRVARGVPSDLWWRLRAADRSPAASQRRWTRVDWLLKWIAEPAIAFALLYGWFGSSAVPLGVLVGGTLGGLAVLLVARTIARGKLTASAGGAAPAHLAPRPPGTGRTSRLWLLLLGSALVVGAVASWSPLGPEGPSQAVGLLSVAAIAGMFASILMLGREYASRWRARRRGP
jgi:hypothetical protein